jgi:protein SCO1/2
VAKTRYQAALSWGLLAITLAVISGAYLKQAVSTWRGTALPVLGHVEDFRLTDQANRPFSRENLLGKTWVVDFIYTSCPGQCPIMSQRMVQVQSLLPKESDVHLLSISVDPTRDTPPALERYARRFHAEPARWYFLTGPGKTIQAVEKNFKITAPPKDAGGREIPHSNRLIIVDNKARIRGYYDGTDNEDSNRLVKDLSGMSRLPSGD